MSNNLKPAETKKFLDLVDGNKGVLMPIYQRDYAQGRESARMIREDFVRELFEAVTKPQTKELNFVYGGEQKKDDNDFFIPIDGQQRLTTLFLFHWYIFMRANATDKEKEQLERFLYATRTTSEKFCNGIIKMQMKNGAPKNNTNVIDFSVPYRENTNEPNLKEPYDISYQIKEQTWFTGNMGSDPTVISMLVTIEEIHKYASKNNVDNFDELKKQLTNDNRIVFLCLDMENALGDETAIRDLYVKMNARGKLLTDFENFKSLLQKEPEDGKIDFVGEYIKKIDCNEIPTRSDIIGLFNNEFANFFFNIVDDGEIIDNSVETDFQSEKEQGFDTAMMNFVIEYLKMAFFVCVDDTEINSDKYRDYVGFTMGGREFYRFITTGGKEYIEKIFDEKNQDKKGKAINTINQYLTDAFIKMMRLLELLSENEEYVKCCETGQNWLKDINSLIKGYTGTADKDENTKNMVARLLSFEFFSRFGINEGNKAFEVWIRFISKLLRNSKFEHLDDAVKTYKSLSFFINNFSEDINAETLLVSISKINPSDFAAPIRKQLEEEKIKASLCANDTYWNEKIKEAEDYFEDGHIWFMLQYSKVDDEYHYNRFENIVNFCKSNISAKKRLEESINKEKFEAALFAINERRENIEETHMVIPSNSSAYQFILGNLQLLTSIETWKNQANLDKQKILLNLIDKIISASDINMALDMIISNADKINIPKWQRVFINQELEYGFEIEGDKFRNCIFITTEGDVLLLIKGTNTRAASFELEAYLLYKKILENDKLKEKTVKFQKEKTEATMENGVPRRYLIIDDKINVGYHNKRFYIWKDKCAPEEKMQDVEVLEYLEKI